MKAKIQPITFLGDTITTLDAWIIHYYLGTNEVRIDWNLTDDGGKVCKEGGSILSGSVVQNWGTDDTVIFNEVASLIGVTIIEFVTE